MIVYTNSAGEIKDVNTTTDPTLTAQEITDGTFDGMSTALICCYRVTVQDGVVVSKTPYIDSRLLEHIDQLGKQTEAITPWTASKTAYVDDTEVTFTDVPQGNTSVYMDTPHTYVRDGSRVTVRFEALTESKEVTISII